MHPRRECLYYTLYYVWIIQAYHFSESWYSTQNSDDVFYWPERNLEEI